MHEEQKFCKIIVEKQVHNDTEKRFSINVSFLCVTWLLLFLHHTQIRH